MDYYLVKAKTWVIISLVVVAFSLTGFVGYEIYRRNTGRINKVKPLSIRLLITSFLLVISVFMLRLALGYYEMVGTAEEVKMSFGGFVGAFLRALQTLSMDEEFGEASKDCQQLFPLIFKKAGTVKFFCVYSDVLNLLTPIFGGAIIFDVLTTFFPRFKLARSFYRNQFIFSELNERSLALAESIVIENKHPLKRVIKNVKDEYNKIDKKNTDENNTDNIKKLSRIILDNIRYLFHPLIVFTDTYFDDDDEKGSELVLHAKGIGALCIKDDISTLKNRCLREKQYFFIDEKDIENIKALSELIENIPEKKIERLTEKTKFFLFYQRDSYSILEQSLINVIDKKIQNNNRNKNLSNKKHPPKEKEKTDNLPPITRIIDYENLILDLLKRKPLFEPLVSEKLSDVDKRDYNLTIFGTGSIGMQMMLSSSWCGQFYGTSLNINLVSQESDDVVRSRINKISPEIFESTVEYSPLLKVFEDGSEYSEPYFNLRFVNSDVEECDLSGIVCEKMRSDKNAAGDRKTDRTESFNIMKSDYFLIALGSDSANIAVAEELKRKLILEHLKTGRKKKVIIAFAVYDSSACKALQTGIFQDEDSGVELYPFGSLDDLYNYRNITAVVADEKTRIVNEIYTKQSGNGSVNQSGNNFYYNYGKNRKNNGEVNYKAFFYNSMSSYSKNIHLKYRIFSAFKFLESECVNCKFMIDGGIDIDAYKTYRDLLLSDKKESRMVSDYLSWLEHRRWNAYLRSTGFVSADKTNKEINLHCCLYEGERPEFDKNGDKAVSGKKDMLLIKSKDDNIKVYDEPGETDISLIDSIIEKGEE